MFTDNNPNRKPQNVAQKYAVGESIINTNARLLSTPGSFKLAGVWF